MSNENSPSRRKFLQRTLSLIPLVTVGSSVISAEALAEKKKEGAEGVSSQYVPTFFNQAEWRFILAAVDQLIPEDALGAGAVSEGVPQYIDKQMELPYGYGHLWYMQAPFANGVPELGYQSSLVPRETYRRGIKAVNQYCQQQFNHDFADLDGQQQIDLLTALEKGQLTFEAVSGKLFFAQLLDNTKEGYLSDPIHGGNQTMASWKLIGFPGARADYQQVMENPNRPYPLGPVSISGKRST